LRADAARDDAIVKNSHRVLVRQWQLVRELSGPRRVGLTIRELTAATGRSKQTIYRDLATLREAGVPLDTRTVNGEARHRLLRDAELPTLRPTSLQIAALHLAREELEPIAGTGLVAELDAFLAKLKPPERQQSFGFGPKHVGRPEILRGIERALHSRRRARIEYRAASRGGRSSSVLIEPLVFRVANRQPYVRAYCVERGAERTYKIDRITRVELTSEPATYVPAVAASGTFARSVKAWSGDPTTARIKLDSDVGWRADEYVLVPGQKVEKKRDGSAVLEARVEGIVETSSWVLSWGGAAEALGPPELRALVHKELMKALRKYDRPETAKVVTQKSTRRVSGRLT
jgi:predicted DNA-binding transcriptional regulator YafY